MLFNSYAFILVFLPITYLIHAQLMVRRRATAAIAWLVVASLFFYGWWNPAYLPLLVGSVLFNFAVGRRIAQEGGPRRAWLVSGLAANLGALGWFKYAGFFAGTLSSWTGAFQSIPQVVLPLAISFFTFQQIAYLVDAYRNSAPRYDLLRYAAFVTFFPQLIAGPIVRHDETIPQLGIQRDRETRREDLAVGSSAFLIGLFKKVVLADGLAAFATPVFDSAAGGAFPTGPEAWGATLAYTFQIYFDFSGYCDMAIGAARLFGITLPLNFNAPYRSTSIVDFWRRWHITLSSFLRDYLYIPLGGNRYGSERRYRNLFITMLLGGLWHGAGWTFVLWGGLHGVYLMVNHAWRALLARSGRSSTAPTLPGRVLGGSLTFLAVVIAWVLFRSADAPTAGRMLTAMLGSRGWAWQSTRIDLEALGVWLALAAAVVWILPTTQAWLRDFRPALGWKPSAGGMGYPLRWMPTTGWAALVATIGAFAFAHLTRVSEFLYFQF